MIGLIDAWLRRLKQVSFPVDNEDEFRRAINLVAARGANSASLGAAFGCEIVICSPMYITRGFTIPAACNGITIRSVGRVPIIPSGAIPFVFEVHAKACTIRDVLVETRDSSHYAQIFAQTSSTDVARNLILEDCIVNADQFFVDAAGNAPSVKIRDCQIATVTNVGLPLIDSASFFGQVIGCQFGAGVALSAVKLEAAAKAWRISDCHGFVSTASCTIDTSASTGNNRLSANSGFASKTIAATDIDDDAALQAAAISSVGANQIALGNVLVGGGLVGLSGVATANLTSDGSGIPQWTRKISSSPQSIALNTAGPTITPGDFSVYRVTHGASASGVVTIAAGTGGQLLVLYFVSVAGTAVYTDGSGNLQLSANFTPTSADTLTLIYEAGSSSWVEIARSVN